MAIGGVPFFPGVLVGKASHCRDHSSGECLWKTGTIIDITPLRSVYGQKEAL